MSQNLQNFAKVQEFQFDNLVDFEKCCKTRFTCKNRCRYSQKRATFCRNFAKNRRRCRSRRPPPVSSASEAVMSSRTRAGLTRPTGKVRGILDAGEIHGLAPKPMFRLKHACLYGENELFGRKNAFSDKKHTVCLVLTSNK